jgi:hypothetical protein
VSDKTTRAALEKLAKWRKFFASWQLGTTALGDGRWTATADVGREKASGDGPAEETALANLRTAVAAAWHRAGSGFAGG